MCTFILYVISLVSGCPNLPAQLLSFYCTAVPQVVHRVAEVSGDQTGVTVLLKYHNWSVIMYMLMHLVHLLHDLQDLFCIFTTLVKFEVFKKVLLKIRVFWDVILCWLSSSLLVAWPWRWSHHNPSSCQEQQSIKSYESASPRRSMSWSAGMWRSVPTFWRNLLPLSSRNKCHISEDHSHNMHCRENLESHFYGTCSYLSF